MITELYTLFAELRRLKQTELLRAEAMEPVERAMQEKRIRAAIRRVEEQIERRMQTEPQTVKENGEGGFIFHVEPIGEGELQLISSCDIRVFASWIDENGNLRCGIRGSENG